MIFSLNLYDSTIFQMPQIHRKSSFCRQHGNLAYVICCIRGSTGNALKVLWCIISRFCHYVLGTLFIPSI